MNFKDYNIHREKNEMYSSLSQCKKIYKFCAVGDDWEEAFMTYTLPAAQRSLQSAKGPRAIIPMPVNGSWIHPMSLMTTNWDKIIEESMKFDNKDLQSFAAKCEKAFNTI